MVQSFIKQRTQIPRLWYLPQPGIEDGVAKELLQNAQPLSGGQSERSRVGEPTNNTDIQLTLLCRIFSEEFWESDGMVGETARLLVGNSNLQPEPGFPEVFGYL